MSPPPTPFLLVIYLVPFKQTSSTFQFYPCSCFVTVPVSFRCKASTSKFTNPTFYVPDVPSWNLGSMGTITDLIKPLINLVFNGLKSRPLVIYIQFMRIFHPPNIPHFFQSGSFIHLRTSFHPKSSPMFLQSGLFTSP